MNVTSFKVTRNATILVLGQTLVSALNYAFWIVLARIATLDVGGGVSTILSIVAIFTFLMQPGIPMATSKYVSEHLSRRNTNMVRATIKSAIIVVLTLSTIAAVLLVLFAERIEGIFNIPEFTTPLRVTAILIAFIPLQGVISGVYQGFQKMEYCFVQSLIVASSKFFLGLGLVLVGFDVIGPVLGMIIGGFCVIILAVFFITRLLQRTPDYQSQSSEKNPEADLFKWTNIIRLGVPNSVIYGVIRLSSQAGTLILFLFGGSLEDAAFYYVPLQVILGITLISQALGFAILPSVSYSWVTKSTSEFESAINLFLRYFFIIIVPIGMIAIYFPEEITRLILGKKYLPAAPIFRILLLTVPFIGTLQIFVSVLTGIGSIKGLIRLSLLLLLGYLFLAVGMIWIFDLIGISGAFACSIAIGAIATIWMTKKATKMRLDLLILAKILVLSTAFLILAIILISLSLGFLLAIFLGLIIYIVLSFVIGTFTREDVVFIINLLRMLTGNLNSKSK